MVELIVVCNVWLYVLESLLMFILLFYVDL